ncbi:MAG: DNA-3-methyladenine glycosylase [Clostridia bacterium]|nr:DNA-3-methyladenine glycosylase [Clostridia bacterium]
MTELSREFYTRDGLTVARELIGKTLVHRVNGGELRGIITETEAYMGVTDKASHAYGGRRTQRTETMYLRGGHAYVYLIYGMYSCMNITASTDGNPEAVLIRCVMPEGDTQGILDNVRGTSRRKKLPVCAEDLSPAELYGLTNGPGKLCNAMGITRGLNGTDMTTGDFTVIDEGWRAREILMLPRVGIDYAEEAAKYPWRFSVPCRKGVPMLV